MAALLVKEDYVGCVSIRKNGYFSIEVIIISGDSPESLIRDFIKENDVRYQEVGIGRFLLALSANGNTIEELKEWLEKGKVEVIVIQ